MQQLLDHSEALTRRALERIPDGTYSFVDYIDNDGVDLNKPVKFQVTVTIKGSDFIADFSGSNPQTKGPFNCTPASVYACLTYALKIITGGVAIPTNEGCFRPISYVLPEKSVVNPIHPAPTGSRSTTMQALASTLLGALVKAAPEYINACSGAYGPLIYFGGNDPLLNKEYLTNEISMVGLGARPSKDGIDVISPDMVNLLSIPVEAFEMTSPFRVLELKLHEDSGGAGEYRGGLGLKKSFRLLRGNCSATFRGERWYIPAWGLFGGLPGRVGKGCIIRKNGDVVDIPSKGDYILNEGDEISFVSSGGGGYGDPLKRKPELVLRDVLDGRVSIKTAADDYGVVIDEKLMTINLEKTVELRQDKAAIRGPITWTYDKARG
jgi:N-methylhydantoinase B